MLAEKAKCTVNINYSATTNNLPVMLNDLPFLKGRSAEELIKLKPFAQKENNVRLQKS